MPEDIRNRRLGQERQRLFINTSEIPGVQTAKVDYNLTNSPLIYAGSTQTKNLPKGINLPTLSVSTFLISDDLLSPLTGALPFNAYIKQSRDSHLHTVTCQSGILTNYSAKYRLNQLPEVSFVASIFGEAGNYSDPITEADNTIIANEVSDAVLKTAGPGCVDINFENFQTNRVLGYDINLNCPRNGIYEIGQTLLPKIILSNSPIEVNCSFQIEIDEYNMSQARATYIPTDSSLTLTIRDFFSNDVITSYFFQNLILISESYTSSVDNNTLVIANYKGFINR